MRKPSLEDIISSHFRKFLHTVEEAISNLFARSSRKRASRSCKSVRKISSSMVSAVDRVVVANGVRNITICKNTFHVAKPVYSCVRESLPPIMYRGGVAYKRVVQH